MTIKKIEKIDLDKITLQNKNIKKEDIIKIYFYTKKLIYEFFANIYEPDFIVDSISNFEQTIRKAFFNLNVFQNNINNQQLSIKNTTKE